MDERPDRGGLMSAEYTFPRYRTAQELMARNEHAWLLRAEGLDLKEIASRIGVKQPQSALLAITVFSQRIRRAMVGTKVKILGDSYNYNWRSPLV